MYEFRRTRKLKPCQPNAEEEKGELFDASMCCGYMQRRLCFLRSFRVSVGRGFRGEWWRQGQKIRLAPHNTALRAKHTLVLSKSLLERTCVRHPSNDPRDRFLAVAVATHCKHFASPTSLILDILIITLPYERTVLVGIRMPVLER